MPKRSAHEAARTRAAIVAAARELFTEQGFSGTTTAEISARAGVTIGALFHHFETKADVFRDVFWQLELEMDSHARERARRKGGLKGFLEGFRAFLEYAQRRDYNRIVMIDGPVVLGDSGWRKLDATRGLETISLGVGALMKAGAIPIQPIKPLSLLLLGAMNECGFAMARGDSGVTIHGCVAAMERLLTR